MRKSILIAILTVAIFWFEFILFNVLGHWFKPNLLLLLIIFFNLSWGIRYSLLAGFLAGLLKDSLSVNVFGFYLLPFVLSAYLTTLVRKYIYQRESRASGILVVFLVSLLHGLIQYLLSEMLGEVPLQEALVYGILPEAMITILAGIPVFQVLRRCASRLSV